MPENAINNLTLSKQVGVSHPTIARWVKDAKAGKNNLQLAATKNKYRVLKNDHNQSELLKLKENAAKYRNKNSFVRLKPPFKLCQTFNESQLINILFDLEKHRRISQKYLSLFARSNIRNTPAIQEKKKLTPLLLANLGYFDLCTSVYSKVNIVDLNSESIVKIESISDLLANQKKVVNYAVVDIYTSSLKEMLFKNQIQQQDSCNLIFLDESLLNQANNWQELLLQIQQDLSEHDFLVLTVSLDDILNRSDFSLFENAFDLQALHWFLNLLGLKPELYEILNRYDIETRSQTQIIKFNKDVDLVVEIAGAEKVLQLIEGGEIVSRVVGMYDQETILSMLHQIGFQVQHFSTDPINNTALLICTSLFQTN